MTSQQNISVSVNSKQAILIDYYPQKTKTSTGADVIILLHGGGWVSGDKSEMDYFAKQLNYQGYTTVNMGYRLAPKIKHPKQLDDISAVIDWVKEQHPNARINLLGFSAGGQLSLLWGYQHPNVINAIISIAGRTDFTKPFINFDSERVVNSYLGDTPLEEASPINAISNESPPTLVIHAKDDDLVPFSDAEDLANKAKLIKMKHPFELKPVESGGHLFLYKKHHADDCINTIDAFLKQL